MHIISLSHKNHKLCFSADISGRIQLKGKRVAKLSYNLLDYVCLPILSTLWQTESFDRGTAFLTTMVSVSATTAGRNSSSPVGNGFLALALSNNIAYDTFRALADVVEAVPIVY